MKFNNIYQVSGAMTIVIFLSLLSLTGCKKYLDIPLPVSKISGEGAYSTDRSTAATLNNVLGTLAGGGYFDGSGGTGYVTGLYTDELQNLNSNSPNNTAYYTDQVTPAQTGGLWTSLYQNIYNLNLTIEGAGASGTLRFKDQWMGEAYFLRALCYFYLTNYYGDVVLAKTSDFLVNKSLGRAPQAEVYQFIKEDLLKAKDLLSNDYKDAAGATTTLRGRPNKFAAEALLARVYLYTGEWALAEAEASAVIAGSTGVTYSLLPSADIAKVFLAASPETIFALAPAAVVKDFTVYNNNMAETIPYNNLSWSGIAAAISSSLLQTFETNSQTQTDDLRKINWLRKSTMLAGGTVEQQMKYFPDKYKSTVVGAESIVLFRLAEQYLIRAEARAKQNNLSGAKEDLNAIRLRAGLTETMAESSSELTAAVIREKRVELFTEVGHRFFDLRRAGIIDTVMSAEVKLKGSGATWNTLKQFFPIPLYDLSVNTNLKQTPGY